MKVTPRCKLRIRKPYVTVDGYYLPCCNIGNEDDLSLYKEFLGDLLPQVDLNKTSLSEAMNSEAMAKLESSWLDGSFSRCLWQCGRPLDPNEKAG